MTDSPLSRIFYISRMAEGVTDDDLKAILQSARANNPKRRITGILCAGGRQFAQILEGPQSEILALYGRILLDRRHYDALLVGIAPISERLFQQWSMGYIAHDGPTMEARRKALVESWQTTGEQKRLMGIMREFLASLRA